MTTMAPRKARAAILDGTAPENLTVDGPLYLSNCTGLTALPDRLIVRKSLYLTKCAPDLIKLARERGFSVVL